MSGIAHWILLSAEVRITMLVRRKSSQSQLQRLFPFERVFDAAYGVLNLALYLVGLALRLQLGVTDRLADHLLHCAFDLLRRSDDPVLVHDFFLECLAGCTQWACYRAIWFPPLENCRSAPVSSLI